MPETTLPQCAKCPTRACAPVGKADVKPDLSKAPAYCPMKRMPAVMKTAAGQYARAGVKEFARQASLQEFECYEHTPEGMRTRNPRILELVQFARKCHYQTLGLAFCGGLAKEGRLLTELMEGHGFQVASVMCKCGAFDKERIGIKPEQKIRGPGQWESMCNPIVQAKVLNTIPVDLAVMLGLCIGHDSLFIKYCRVPMTVVAVKDRVTGHNPLAALYLADSYYARLKGTGR